MVSYLENKIIHDLIQGEKADLTQLKPKLNLKKPTLTHKIINPLFPPCIILNAYIMPNNPLKCIEVY